MHKWAEEADVEMVAVWISRELGRAKLMAP